ncbi:MAG: hypothetical protein KKE94_16640 [Gammaproteobacteria bacterium]|nr:hypothetical protein [Gammaproteobacteria bacterium]
MSLILLKITALPEQSLDDLNQHLTRLPFPSALSPGMKLDGYKVLQELFASSRSYLYLVEDEASGAQLVLKCPSLNYDDEALYIGRFIREEWIGLRIHQDLKPGNIIYLQDGRLKIVDFGSVYVAGLAEIYSPLQHEAALGTAAYSGPHYSLGHNSGVQGDIYALATIAYELFSGGHLPYGAAVEECRTAADYDKLRYRSASQFNPVIPTWFDRALQKGVSLDLSQRYQSINQLLTNLQQPNPAFLHEEVKQQHKTNPLLFWQLLSGFGLLPYFWWCGCFCLGDKGVGNSTIFSTILLAFVLHRGELWPLPFMYRNNWHPMIKPMSIWACLKRTYLLKILIIPKNNKPIIRSVSSKV